MLCVCVCTLYIVHQLPSADSLGPVERTVREDMEDVRG